MLHMWKLVGAATFLMACGGGPFAGIASSSEQASSSSGAGGTAGDGGAATSGSGGESAEVSSSTAGTGGSTGGGGSGGEGGACQPIACADVHGACGVIADGCGGEIDCTDPCGGPDNLYLFCDEGTNLCACYPAAGNAAAEWQCDNNEAVLNFCEGHPGGCAPWYCGDGPQPAAPESCDLVGAIAGAESSVWCCYSDP